MSNTPEIIIASILVMVSISNLIIYRNKRSMIKMIVGLLVAAGYFIIWYFDVLSNNTIYIYDFIMIALLVVLCFLYFPKKITKNITEYDYFELEKAYNDLEKDRTKLKDRFLSMLNLVDEGVIFYENGNNDIFLSENAHSIFGGKQSLQMEEHLFSIDERDRENYKKTIERAKNTGSYEMKYRITNSQGTFWVLERGIFIGSIKNRSIIASIKSLDVRPFAATNYIEFDELKESSKMVPIIANYLASKKSFSIVCFEMSNIPDINEKYGRDYGNLMMNDYIRFLRNEYQRDITKFYRLSGIKFYMIIDDEKSYDFFHKDLIDSGSDLYTQKTQIGNIKDTIKPNFGIIEINNPRDTKDVQKESVELIRSSARILNEAIESTRRNYSIYNY